MPLTTQGRNDLLTNGLTAFTHIALLNASQTEITGGAPAYARKAVTWTTAAAGVRDNNADLVFDVAAGLTVAYWSAHSAITAGNQEAFGQIGSTLRGVATMQQSDDIFRSDAHGLVDTNQVFVAAVAGEAIPTGINATTLYFVVTSTADTFQLSATSGGAAINLTTDGEIAWFRTVPEVFGSQGTLTISTGNLDVDANFV